MQATLGADAMDRALCAQAPSSASRLNRFLVAGVAVVGATAIAATPVTPSMPTAHDVQQHAVTLAAAANPLDDFGALFKNTLTNVGTLGNDVLTSSLPAVAQAITNPAIYADFVQFLGSNALNPLPLLQQAIGFPGTYGGVIGAGLQAGSDALQLRLSQLPTVVTNTLEFLRTGQFVEAFSEVNVWFLVSIERALVPLLPTLQILGDVLASLPNGQRLAAVFDTVLKRGVFTEFTRSILGPLASAGLQFALVLDDIRNAVVTGDFGAAASQLVGLPIKVTNALVNGFVPPFTSRSPWTGILGDRGTLDYFFVDLPKALADAFNNPVYPVPTPPVTTPAVVPQSLVADVTSTDLTLSGDTVALEAVAASSVEEAAPAAEATPAAPVEPVEETAPAAEVEEAAPAAETETPTEVATGTDTTGGSTAGEGASDDTKSEDTKSDDTKSEDTKSEDTKSDDTKSEDTKSDDKKSDDKKSDDKKSTDTKSGVSKPSETKSGASASAGSTSGGSDSGSGDSGSSE